MSNSKTGIKIIDEIGAVIDASHKHIGSCGNGVIEKFIINNSVASELKSLPWAALNRVCRFDNGTIKSIFKIPVEIESSARITAVIRYEDLEQEDQNKNYFPCTVETKITLAYKEEVA